MIRGATQFDQKGPLSVYQHIRRLVTDAVAVSPYSKPFKTALESPFHFQRYTAFPPPAALWDIVSENVLLFLIGLFFMMVAY